MGETSEIPPESSLEGGGLITIVGIAAEILQTLINDTATSQMQCTKNNEKKLIISGPPSPELYTVKSGVIFANAVNANSIGNEINSVLDLIGNGLIYVTNDNGDASAYFIGRVKSSWREVVVAQDKWTTKVYLNQNSRDFIQDFQANVNKGGGVNFELGIIYLGKPKFLNPLPEQQCNGQWYDPIFNVWESYLAGIRSGTISSYSTQVYHEFGDMKPIIQWGCRKGYCYISPTFVESRLSTITATAGMQFLSYLQESGELLQIIPGYKGDLYSPSILAYLYHQFGIKSNDEMSKWLSTFIGSQFVSSDACPGSSSGCSESGVSALIGATVFVKYYGFTPGFFIAFPSPKLQNATTQDLVDWMNKVFYWNPKASDYINFIIGTVSALNSVIHEIKSSEGENIAEAVRRALLSTVGYTTDKNEYREAAKSIIQKIKKAIQIAKNNLQSSLPEYLKGMGATRNMISYCMGILDSMINDCLQNIDYSEDTTEDELADQIQQCITEESQTQCL